MFTRLLSLDFRSQRSHTSATLALWASSLATNKKLFEGEFFYYQPTKVSGMPTLGTMTVTVKL